MTIISRKQIIFLFLIVLVIPVVLAATRVFTVEETDFVKITPSASDLDNDKVSYQYSSPLDEKGEWQTGYDDAGEYDLRITASDGVNEVDEKVKLIVKNKNQPPILSDKRVMVLETQTVDLTSLVEDPDQDILTYTFNSPFDQNGKWKTTYNDAGVYIVDFTASDGKLSASLRVEVQVENKNQPPQITETFSVSDLVALNEDSTLEFFVETKDEDSLDLTYEWFLEGKKISSQKTGEYYFDYDSAGEYHLNLKVSDEETTIEKEWFVSIADKNRKPQVYLGDIHVNEGEIVKMEVPEHDDDGDALSYTYSLPFNEQGEWQTGNNNSGIYNVTIAVSDGVHNVSVIVKVEVTNVDQAPTLLVPEQVEGSEGEKLEWVIDVSDPDNDKIEIEVFNLPQGAIFNKTTKKFTWIPGFETIMRSQGMVSNFLNALRLEHFLLDKKKFYVEIKACAKDQCVAEQVPIIISNVNRAPQLIVSNSTIVVQETEPLALQVNTTDPDADIVRFYFTEPLQKRAGTWKTSFDDEGEYLIYVTATDGELSTTEPVKVQVTKKNRAPSIQTPQDEFVVEEGRELSFEIKTADSDNDNVSVSLHNNSEQMYLSEGVVHYQPNFTSVDNYSEASTILGKIEDRFIPSQKTEVVEIVAFDGVEKTTHGVKITIKNTNRPPQIVSSSPNTPLRVSMLEPVTFSIEANDPDKDPLTYTWSFGVQEGQIKNAKQIERVFVTPGYKKVKVKISDGINSVDKEWIIEVEQAAPKQNIEQASFASYVIER